MNANFAESRAWQAALKANAPNCNAICSPGENSLEVRKLWSAPERVRLLECQHWSTGQTASHTQTIYAEYISCIHASIRSFLPRGSQLHRDTSFVRRMQHACRENGTGNRQNSDQGIYRRCGFHEGAWISGTSSTHRSASLLGGGRVGLWGCKGGCIGELGVQHKGLVRRECILSHGAILSRRWLEVRPLLRAVVYPAHNTEMRTQMRTTGYPARRCNKPSHARRPTLWGILSRRRAEWGKSSRRTSKQA